MPERLVLTKNVQFYKTNNDLDDNIISSILNEASSNQESDSESIIEVYRDIKVTAENVEYQITIKVFPTIKPVFFLNDECVEDRIYAFIVLIELNDYLVVLSKSCSNFSQILKDKFELIQTQDLSKLLSNNVEFQKMSLRNMTVSDKAVRNRSFEASNLKGTLPTHAVGRSIPSHIKVRDGGSIKSISSTGRLVESSVRESVDNIVDWANHQIELLTTSNQNDFLSLFAKKVQLRDVLVKSKPSSLLIDIGQISDGVLSGDLKIKYELDRVELVNGRKKKSKKLINVSARFQLNLFSNLEEVFEINSDLHIIGFEKSSKIRVNKSTISLITQSLLKKIKIEENNKIESLMTYINRKGLFSVTFDDPKFMYFMDSCFEDTSGISEVDSILEMLEPQKNIEKIISEKGTFKSTQESFDLNSMFGFIEHIFKSDDYIFCDDLGDEWADHITLNLKDFSINFIHSKYLSKTTNSASKLHDVIGQGIKNLGNMHFSRDQINIKHKSKFATFYKSGTDSIGKPAVQTEINRIRKQGKDFCADIESLLKSHKLHRKCILACSFISKKNIKAEFEKIKNGQFVRGHIIQFLWILSSFAHAAKDANVIPLIYCRE